MQELGHTVHSAKSRLFCGRSPWQWISCLILCGCARSYLGRVPILRYGMSVCFMEFKVGIHDGACMERLHSRIPYWPQDIDYLAKDLE